MFSKAERFKEKAPQGPPIGAYDAQLLDASCGPVTFERASRFRRHTESSDADTVDFSFADDSLCAGTSHHNRPRTPNPNQKSRVVRKEKKTPVDHTKVIELEKEIKRLLAERNDLSKQLMAARQDISKLEGKLQVALRDKSALQAQVARLQKTNYDISRSKNILQERAAHSVDARKATSLQYKLENASQQLEMNQKEIHKLNSELDTSTRQLWQDLTETQDERSQLLARVMDLEQELEQAKETRKASEKQISELKESYAEMERLSTSVQESLSKSQQICEDREALLVEAKQQIATHSEDNCRLEQQMKDLEDERVRLQKEVAIAEQTVAENIQTNNELHQKLRSSQDEVKGLRKDGQDLQEQLSTAKAEMDQRDKEIKRLEMEHQEALESITRKCLAFEEELAQQKQISRETQAVLKSQLMTMEVSSKEQAKECKRWIQECQSALSHLKEEQTENASLKTQMEKMKVEHQKSEEILKSNLQQVLGIAEELKEKEAQSKTEVLERHKGELQAELDGVNHQLQEAREKVTTLQKQLQNATSMAEEVVEERMGKLKQEMSRRLVETQKKLSIQEAQHTKLQSDTSGQIAELKDELQRLQEEKERVERAYAEMEERYRPYQDQIDGLEDLNKLLQSQTSLAQHEAQKLGDQYARLLGHQNQKQKIQHVKKLKDENAGLKLEVTQLRTEISRHKRTIRRLEEERGQKSTHESAPLALKN